MKAAGLDALLVWKNENVRYLSGLRAQIIAGKSAVLNGCLLLPEGPPILLASGGEVQRANLVMPWIEEIYAVPIMEARGLVRGMVEQDHLERRVRAAQRERRLGHRTQAVGPLVRGVAVELLDATMLEPLYRPAADQHQERR
jgi:Xaa-Pro aminopeptidase